MKITPNEISLTVVKQGDGPLPVLFPPFRLDLAEERLWKGHVEVRLRRKPFAILRHLVKHPRRLVPHSELVEAVWGGRMAMSESLLRTHVRDLRRVLGEGIIETVVGRGYRFTAELGPRGDEGRSEERPALALVRSPEPAVVGPTATAAGTRILEELAGALASLGPNAKVLLIVGDAVS